MSTVPASLFSKVTPGVLGAGGDAVNVTGMVLTSSIRVPVGTVMSFPGDEEVGAFFGLASPQLTFAEVYFGGYIGATAVPGALKFTQYNQAAVAAYLWGGNAGAALTLAQLQALSGSLTVVVDGYTHVISSISLAGYNSFSAAAAGIQASFTDPGEASFTASIGCTFTGSGSGTNLTVSAVAYGIISVGDTLSGTGVPSGTKVVSQTSGTTGGDGVYVTSVATTASSASLTAASNVLDVTGGVTGVITAGLLVAGSGVTGSPSILSQLSGTTGGVGTYQLSGAQQTVVPSEAMTSTATAPTVTFDSTSGAFVITSGITGASSTAAFATGTLAAPLLLTAAGGAYLSQGAAPATPSAFMTSLVAVDTDWVTFTTEFDPDGGVGNAQKQLFAAWNTEQDDQFAYIAWDTDVTPTESVPASSSLGYILQQNGNSGTVPIYEPTDLSLSAFVMGAAASINFNQTNGRITFAFKGQAGLEASVTTGAAAVNLGGSPQAAGSFGNGYNYYAAVGAANANFLWFQRGTITGPFIWLDSYINQIVMNSSFQVAMLSFLGTTPSIPFNQAGAALIEQVLAPVIQQFGPPGPLGGFGAFAPGIISASQIAEVNAAAGASIATSLQTQGYYLQVLQQSSAVRANRGPWAITFWYLDRGSVQSLDLSSIAVQ